MYYFTKYASTLLVLSLCLSAQKGDTYIVPIKATWDRNCNCPADDTFINIRIPADNTFPYQRELNQLIPTSEVVTFIDTEKDSLNKAVHVYRIAHTGKFGRELLGSIPYKEVLYLHDLVGKHRFFSKRKYRTLLLHDPDVKVATLVNEAIYRIYTGRRYFDHFSLRHLRHRKAMLNCVFAIRIVNIVNDIMKDELAKIHRRMNKGFSTSDFSEQFIQDNILESHRVPSQETIHIKEDTQHEYNYILDKLYGIDAYADVIIRNRSRYDLSDKKNREELARELGIEISLLEKGWIRLKRIVRKNPYYQFVYNT